jgi:hypothetical protein
MVNALLNGKNAKAARDTVSNGAWKQHGNTIAYYANGNLRVTLSGYNSVSTRERLNQLLTSLGLHRVSFSQKNYEAVIKVDGKVVTEIDPDDVWTIDELKDMVKGSR